MSGQAQAFLGQYLVTNGVVSREQLETAIRSQKRDGTPLQNHAFLGEALLRTGAISEGALREALARFEAEILAQDKLVAGQLEGSPVSAELRILLNAVLRCFYRLGYAARVLGTRREVPDYFERVFYVEQIIRGGNARYMGLGVTNMLVQSVAGNGRSDSPPEPDLDTLEAMSQLVFNLNYTVCRTMKQHGIPARHGPALIGPPPTSAGNGTCIELESATGPMGIVYLHE